MSFNGTQSMTSIQWIRSTEWMVKSLEQKDKVKMPNPAQAAIGIGSPSHCAMQRASRGQQGEEREENHEVPVKA
jgi:hypothetical protein